MSLQLASLFQDHAVLQRGQPLPVWGCAAPHTRIRVTLAAHTASAIANLQGDFLVRLPALPAGGPHTLTVIATETGERVEIRDLLVGEVWLASGQSNMEMRLNACRPLTDADIVGAEFPAIRFFNVATRAHLGPQRTVEGRWQASTPDTAGVFSAAAFSFARRLHRELGVPVGIVSSSWGGSIIQSWLSRSALALNPEVAPWLARYEDRVWTEQYWDIMSSPGPDGRVSGTPKDPGNTGLECGWHQPAFDDAAWSSMLLPGTWQAAGHKHSGVYWFRRTVQIPAAWVGRDLHLHFGGIDKQDVSYVNGIEVGRTGKDREDQYWNAPRRYTIPASAVTSPTLHIAVRVYSFIYDGGIIGADTAMRVTLGDDAASSVALAGEWRHHCEHNLGLVTETHLMGHGERNSPHMLFDNMLQPLVPYALRGVIWYQGEGNAGEAHLYTRLMRDLILDWRQQWGQSDLAFHLVQLPNFQAAMGYQPASHWAHFREAQTAALDLPHTGMAITIDLGEAGDIHPKNKIPVGERLAQSVLTVTYGRAGAPCGPLFEHLTREHASLRCHFRHAESGLATTDGQAPRLFFIADDNRVFHPAEARVEGASVVVSHPEIPRPSAVRYAWADNPERCNLANRAGDPASPFRSDRW